RRRTAAAADVRVVVLHLLQGVGAAVGHAQHGGGQRRSFRSLCCFCSRLEDACTVSTISFRLSSGELGRTPWPRLKMCPGRPPAARSTSSVRSTTVAAGPSSA